ncbi:MAG: YdbL family protein [Alphaproteobacteria bacterium]|nr:YdbL family protein [Alphaproteobacteria bacterium]
MTDTFHTISTRSAAAAISRRRLLWLAALTPVFAVAAPAAKAQSLNQLRASGAIGERFDGYCVARSGGAATAVANSVNAERRKIYAKRAAEQGVPVDQVGRVYAKQIFDGAPSGTFFQQEGGKWVQK